MVLIMGLGTELKEAREAQGISLDTLQETTKIQKRYLQAIEEEKFHVLPGKFYARAFIKEYANAVGLDPNVLMEQHQDDIPTTESESTVQYTQMQRSRRDQNTQKSTRAFSVFPIIIVIFLVIGIIFFAWYLTQVSGNDNNEPVNDNNNNNDEIYLNSDEESNNDSEEQGNNNEDNGENATNDEDADDSNNDEDDDSDESEPEFSVVNEGSGNSPESELDFKYDGDEVTLELESDDATWLDVKTDSESLYSSNLTPDESPVELDVSDEDNVSLNIGNAPSLKVSINGVEMEYPVDQQIVHQKIKINLINENE